MTTVHGYAVDIPVQDGTADAWVVGDEQVIPYDFAGGMAADYAKAKEG